LELVVQAQQVAIHHLLELMLLHQGVAPEPQCKHKVVEYLIQQEVQEAVVRVGITTFQAVVEVKDFLLVMVVSILAHQVVRLAVAAVEEQP
jgi:hypothetical protein